MRKSLSFVDERDNSCKTRHRKESLINTEMMMMIEIQKHLIDSYRVKLKNTYNQLSCYNKNFDIIKKTNDFNPDDLIDVIFHDSSVNTSQYKSAVVFMKQKLQYLLEKIELDCQNNA